MYAFNVHCTQKNKSNKRFYGGKHNREMIAN